MTIIKNNFEIIIRELQSAIETNNTEKLTELTTLFAKFYVDYEGLISKTVDKDSEMPVEFQHGCQSRQFMIDMLPMIQRYLHTLKRGSVLDVIDVGPASGLGTHLLASLYARSRLGYRMRVHAIDIRDRWKNYIQAMCPHIASLIIDDIYRLDRRFDIVICSHVIEHVPYPEDFVRRLQQIAKNRVFLCAPYNEDRDTMSKSHCNIIDEFFINKFCPVNIDLIKSPGWGPFEIPERKIFVAELIGTLT